MKNLPILGKMIIFFKEFCHLFIFCSLYIVRDQTHVTRFQEGDYSGFESLYEKYVDHIFAFVRRKTSDTVVAEDLTSTIWMKALTALESFGTHEKNNFKSWIYTIAWNTVTDYYRTRKDTSSLDDVHHVGLSPDFLSSIENSDKLGQVVGYLEELSDIEQEIVTLRVWDDLSYKQIAKIIGKKEDNCKKIYSRTLKKIAANITVLMLIILMF